MKDIEWLLNYLLSRSEAEWFVEFKHNFDKEKFWKNISALANTALVKGLDYWYLVYGIEDGTKKIVWTNFNPNSYKPEGNQALHIRISQNLAPKIDINFFTIIKNGLSVVIAEISSAKTRPIRFKDIAYIKIWESTVDLKGYPHIEQKIWNNERNKNFEKTKVLEWITSADKVLQLLDFDKYFRLSKQPLPTEIKWFVEKLIQEKFVIEENDGTYSITALWALLFANNIEDFDLVSRKALRIIAYEGNTKEKRKVDLESKIGYASVFEAMIADLITIIWNNEVITESIRVDNKKYPPFTLREFIVNALIHQDFSISWAWPLIEIFDNRIEITNPWTPLIDVERFIDHPSRTRNPDLSKKMRNFWFCEESWSGVDRALIQVELYQLPAPKFEVYEDFTKVTLFASKKLGEMSESDKIRACYQHCVLMHLKWEEKMQNASLRKRLNIAESNYPAASKIISQTLKTGKIKPWEKPKEYIPLVGIIDVVKIL